MCVFWHKRVYMRSKVNFKIYAIWKKHIFCLLDVNQQIYSIKLNYDIQITLHLLLISKKEISFNF